MGICASVDPADDKNPAMSDPRVKWIFETSSSAVAGTNGESGKKGSVPSGARCWQLSAVAADPNLMLHVG